MAEFNRLFIDLGAGRTTKLPLFLKLVIFGSIIIKNYWLEMSFLLL